MQAASIVCVVWDAHQQLAFPLLGAFKRNVTLHSKWDLTYGIKASLKPHLLQKRLCLARDFLAEKVNTEYLKNEDLFLFFAHN